MASGTRRFEFGWLEVFGLILVFAGGSVVVFFLGVFVGKGLQESRLAREERVVRLPIDSAETGGKPAKENELPLYDQLARGGAQATPEVSLAVRPAGTATAAPTSAPTPQPTVSPHAGAAVPAAPVTTATEVRVAAIPTPSPRASVTGAVRGNWSVQVNATKDSAMARRIVEDLRTKGYNAYTVEVPLRGEVWYRVRVGRFPSMGAATAMVVRLKSEERYTRAFLVEE